MKYRENVFNSNKSNYTESKVEGGGGEGERGVGTLLSDNVVVRTGSSK